MKILRFLLLFTVSLITGCIGTSKIVITSKNRNPSGEAILLSASLTAQSSASVKIKCLGGSTHYLEKSTRPNGSDAGWVACSDGEFTINPILSGGDNNLKFWFKNIRNTVTESSLDLYIKQGNYFAISSPDSMQNGYFSVEAVIELSPTRFVVTDSYNSLYGVNAGAFHIYNNFGNLIKSVYGENAGDLLGGDGNLCNFSCSGTLKKLGTNHLVAIFPDYDGNRGLVTVYNFDGDELWRLSGDDAGDYLGSSGSGVIELASGNLVISSVNDKIGGLANAGSVKIVNSSTGAVIASINGDDAGDRLGNSGVIELANGNLVIKSASDKIGGLANAGSVKIINGSTGAVIASINGDDAGDRLRNNGVIKLANGNLVIKSSNDKIGGLGYAGSVILVPMN